MKMDMFQGTLFRDLEKLNYSINESKVYLTLIKIGSSLAGDIAKEAQLDRSSTYNALKSLVERGVVSTVYENKRTIFVPENPKKIVDYYREKEEIAKKIIPKLQEQYKFKKEKSTVKLFRGNKGVKTVFQDILDSNEKGDTYFVMGSEGHFSNQMPYYAPIFTKRKELKKIKTKVLMRESRRKKETTKFSSYRTIPSEVESPTTVNIYADKVAIFIWDETPQAILIENKTVKKTFENYFEFMWKNAKKLKRDIK
jgi:HTH-type transcriptional regulator, sugar sensing transcriptional regulator